jgi:hypothetical protein
MVAGMALQAERGHTYREQIRVRGAVRCVADQAILRHRRMLVHVRPAVLRMAAKAELIYVRQAQIIARRAAVWVMAIHTSHLGFA